MVTELFQYYCIFDLNEMFDLLHHFTTQKSMKMKNRPPSAHKELKNENYAKKGAELFHPQCLVLRLQTIFQTLRKKRPQSVKLKSSQSGNDRPRNNSGKGCHQTDTLLG